MSNEGTRGGVLKEIDEMLDISLDEPRTEAPVTEPPETDDEHKTEPPTTEEPAEEVVTDAPTTEEPGTEAPTTNAPKVDYETEIRSLRAELEELRGKKREPQPTKPPATQPPLEEVDFIGDEDPEDLVRDKDALNKLLNKVHSMGVEVGARRSEEGVLLKIPDLVKKNLDLATVLKETTEDFYKVNKDLLPFRKVCGTVFEELASDHPDWTYQKTLEETGVEVRKRLELKPVKQEPTKGGKKRERPTFPRRQKGGPGRRGGVPSTRTDSLLKEIDKMNEV